MRRWGLVISGFYALLVVSLFVPAQIRLVGGSWNEAFREAFRDASLLPMWVPAVLLVAGQGLLLFMSVDTSWPRVKPRQHIAVAAALIATFAALLALGFISAVWTAVATHSAMNSPASPWHDGWWVFILWLFGLWAVWGAAFFAYYRSAPVRMATAVSWLLRGSALELLVAVPAHVIVRRKDECSAPIATGFGIVTGIAVMLACFGPGVLALYKKRFDGYRKRRTDAAIQR